MNNTTLQIKFKQRLNKLASNDYDNIECWQIVEAFNKAQVEWCRRQLHGNNMYKEGDEASKRRVDDLQPLLESVVLTGDVSLIIIWSLKELVLMLHQIVVQKHEQ